MKREIQKRKKGFWALCLAILLAWMQLAPQVVYAANYTVDTDGNTSFDITDVTYLKPGDVITYAHGSAYAGDSVIEYYDKDGTTRIDWESNTTSGIVTGAQFSVKTYTGTQIESGLFKAWEKKSITGTSGYVSKIILQAVEYPKSNIKYVINDVEYTSSLNPAFYYEGKGLASLQDESKEGYTFDGWFTDASFTAPVTSISASQTGDVKLYAKFTKIVILSDGKGSITIENANYGETINPICVSETNGTENVSVTYKMKGADDATYTETVPVKPGDYTARAVFAKTDAYKQVTATCDFSIAYLTTPANPYAISGTKGKNNYYTTNVTITPAAGYLIADALDGTYQEKLEFSKTTDAFSVYLKKTDTGAKTAGIKVAEIKIDKSAPVISGAKNGQTIYGDEGKIVVKDANLSRVTVNGKKILIAEKSLEIPLSSQRGEEKYVIIAHDLAGNKKKLTVTVAAEWTKKKSIPSGEKVKLYKNRSYSFGTKTFKVSNDDTTYAANTTFYVGSDGDYVFSETN